MVLGFVSIDLFSRHQVLTSERRAQVQNEVSYVLEHMSKNISRAIGNANQIPVTIRPLGLDATLIIIWVDSNQNGRCDNYTNGDRAIAYFSTGTLVPLNRRFEVGFCLECNGGLINCLMLSFFNLANRISRNTITSLTAQYNPIDDFVDVELTGCWDPDGTPFACGTSDNPTVTMRTRIKMPSVSTN
jgi:hypothetical protein